MSLCKSLAVVAAATLVGLLTVGVGRAGADPLMTIDPNSVEVGTTVTVSGTECSWVPDAGGQGVPGQVTVVIAGEPAGQTAADGDGTWSVGLPAPVDAGSYQVDATCDRYQGAFDYPAQELLVTGTTTEPAPPTAIVGEVTRQGCRVSIPVTTTGPGPFTLTVWDDGDVVHDMSWNPGIGPATTVLNWLITAPAGEESPGVGLYVTVTLDGEVLELTGVDPFEYPASIAEACGEAGGMTIALVDHPGSVPVGEVVRVEAAGFWPGEQVTVVLHSDPVQLATLTADANGTVSGSLVIPASTPPGSHTLVLTGVLSLLSTQIGVVVTARSGSTAPPPAATVTATATATATATETETETGTETEVATATAPVTATATPTATATATDDESPAMTGTASPAVSGTASSDEPVGAGGSWTDASVPTYTHEPVLAGTGTDAAGMSLAGLGLLLGGGAFLALGRRRRTAGKHR